MDKTSGKKIGEWLVWHSQLLGVIGFSLLMIGAIMSIVIYNRYYPYYIIKTIAFYCAGTGIVIYIIGRALSVVKRAWEKKLDPFREPPEETKKP